MSLPALTGRRGNPGQVGVHSSAIRIPGIERPDAPLPSFHRLAFPLTGGLTTFRTTLVVTSPFTRRSLPGIGEVGANLPRSGYQTTQRPTVGPLPSRGPEIQSPVVFGFRFLCTPPVSPHPPRSPTLPQTTHAIEMEAVQPETHTNTTKKTQKHILCEKRDRDRGEARRRARDKLLLRNAGFRLGKCSLQRYRTRASRGGRGFLPSRLPTHGVAWHSSVNETSLRVRHVGILIAF